MEKRRIKDYLAISLKGVAMGAADVVPGVSGGTIAFITGIYEEFITSLKSIDHSILRLVLKGKLKDAFEAVNGRFLVALFLGIAISVVSLAKVITSLLADYPILVWSFFFGLIIASVFLIGKEIKKWKPSNAIGLLAGTAIAYYITIATPAQTPEALWFVFLSGMIAICAMILPGISGSFVLLLMGKYAFILEAVSEMNFLVIGTLGAGCAVGLLSFSRVLSYMFKRAPEITIATLTGFMIGSLNKVWPWKETLQWRINSHGERLPFIQKSVLPSQVQEEPMLWGAIGMMVVGFVAITLLETLGSSRQSA